ncbi:MAG: CDGSH iron-sulfur domain-containing protein [Caldithrix sp.]|nr:CDGSH iron-sulfur domain-containing protein [Caldithrix sp.]
MADKKIPQKEPYVMEMQPGKYAWCNCAESSNQPFCDGSHRGTGLRPITVEIKEKQEIAWCGCKRSGNKPYCDGTHNNL